MAKREILTIKKFQALQDNARRIDFLHNVLLNMQTHQNANEYGWFVRMEKLAAACLDSLEADDAQAVIDRYFSRPDAVRITIASQKDLVTHLAQRDEDAQVELLVYLGRKGLQRILSNKRDAADLSPYRIAFLRAYVEIRQDEKQDYLASNAFLRFFHRLFSFCLGQKVNVAERLADGRVVRSHQVKIGEQGFLGQLNRATQAQCKSVFRASV